MDKYFIDIGNVRIMALTDATLERPPRDIFPDVPDTEWPAYNHLHTPGGRMRFNIGSTLLFSRGRTILVDTGIGKGPVSLFGEGPFYGSLVDDVRRKGVDPDDVDIVVFTHLHLTGWNFSPAGWQRRPTFPRAHYLVQQAEWDLFTSPEGRRQSPYVQQQIEQNVMPLAETGRLRLISGEYAVTPELIMLPTPGHTPSHVSILVSSADQKAICWGEVIVHPAQVTHPDWNPHYDMDPDAARRTRRAVLAMVEAANMTVVANHFPEPGFGTITRRGEERHFHPINQQSANQRQ